MTTTTETNSTQRHPLWFYLFGIIDRPVATFEAVLKRRKWTTWALPLAIVLGAFVIVTVIHTPYTLEVSRAQAEKQLAEMPAEQAEMARATLAVTLSLPFMLALGLGIGAAILVLGTLIQSAFFYFGALIMGGDDLDFGAVFPMSAWSRLPMAFGYLVQTGIILVTQSMFKYPGLSYLVASGDLLEDAKNPMFLLLSNIDLFWLWHLLLAVLGLAVVARISRGKSLVLVAVYAVLAVSVFVLPPIIIGRITGT